VIEHDHKGLALLEVIAEGHPSPYGVIDNGSKGFEFEKRKSLKLTDRQLV